MILTLTLRVSHSLFPRTISSFILSLFVNLWIEDLLTTILVSISVSNQFFHLQYSILVLIPEKWFAIYFFLCLKHVKLAHREIDL